jgi:hypothetical protein
VHPGEDIDQAVRAQLGGEQVESGLDGLVLGGGLGAQAAQDVVLRHPVPVARGAGRGTGRRVFS